MNNKRGVFSFILLGVFKLCISDQHFEDNKYDIDKNYKGVRERLEAMMQEHYRDCVKRVPELNEIRFTYEESPHYEIGYIMGEIVERYKKIVFNIKRPTLYISDTVFETLRNLEWIQKYYFEIYHLINMMHEIPSKWKGKKEFEDLSNPPNYKEMKKREQLAKQMEKLVEKEKKKRLKKLKKMQKTQQSSAKENTTDVVVKQYNKWWPIDYGWEIDYYW